MTRGKHWTTHAGQLKTQQTRLGEGHKTSWTMMTRGKHWTTHARRLKTPLAGSSEVDDGTGLTNRQHRQRTRS